MIQPQLRERARPGADVQAVLDALESSRCRDLLALLGERALTAGELATRTDIPRSSLYRYLNRLVEAGLVDAAVRIEQGGNHETEYARQISDVVVSLSPEEGVSVGLY